MQSRAYATACLSVFSIRLLHAVAVGLLMQRRQTGDSDPLLHSRQSAVYVLQHDKKGSPYSVLGSQPAGGMSHKPGSRLPLLPARPAVTPTSLERAATNFAAW